MNAARRPTQITLGTDQDPYNKEELVNTLKGRELGFFVIFYIFAVACIVMAFEFLKPSLFMREESVNATRYDD
ncbi:unnamed protein product [Caenorhabditis angaria]|uniref:Uncharacterized protein n=1 Tax=Caenorhabditis angaria TaxID=860376 RepID=A0A9P1ID47_9PELO|nr:unnamed protein product [Caenorhabditis angaria]